MQTLVTRMLPAAISVSLVLTSCGAKLPTVVSKNRPVAVETAIDLNLVNFTHLQAGTSVNLGQYMDQNNLKYMVLTFGSKGCGICMEKARYFQANLINDSYNLIGKDAKSKFQLVGITTDPTSSRDELLALIEDQGLSHLAWSDPGHLEMMKYFQPSGRDFSVPLTVMLSRQGILWRITSDQHVTPEDIIRKIGATLGEDVELPPPPPPPPPPPEFEVKLLAREVPSRLNEVELKSCADRSVAKLGSLLPPVANGLRAVLVHKDSCAANSDCDKARQELISWKNDCSSQWQKSCEFEQVTIGEDLCSTKDRMFTGGGELYDVFADHFNWNYKPVSAGPGRIKLPEITGPITMVFDEAGRLVLAKEGALNGALISGMNDDRLASRVTGPNFAAAWNTSPADATVKTSSSNFSTMRARAKFTIAMFWNTWCSSCIIEIEEWHSEPDSAYNFCRENPDFCQVVAVETGQTDSGLPAMEYLNEMIHGNMDFDGWKKKNWTMPIAVEDNFLSAVNLSGAFAATDAKSLMEIQPPVWFAGWVRARFGSSEPRTLLYDVEGKVLGAWKSLPGEHGPREAIKSLHRTSQKF